MSEPAGPNEFVSEAYNLEDDASMVQFYQKWAEEYDAKMINELGYISAEEIAKILNQFVTDKEAKIFDIGCGTGLTCKFLAENGYSNLEGIDLSPDMVRVAEQRGIYQKLFVGDVNLPLELDSESYDGVISSGTFTHGHVGPEPLDDIFRILKSGGILACTVHQDLWESRGFKDKFNIIVNSGVADCLKLEIDKYYKTGEPEGWFCVYRKNS